MTLELLSSLARSRRDHLLRQAANRRSLARGGRARPSLRATLARVIRATGYAVLSLGDALAETR